MDDNITVQITKWLEYCKKSYSSDTNRCYKSIFKQLLLYIMDGESNSAEFNAEVVESWLTQKLESCGSRQTYNCYLTTIRSFCNWRLKKYGLKSDIKTIPKLKMNRKTPRVLSEAEFRFIVDYCELAIDKHILLFLGNTGIRKEELRQLKWGDVDPSLRFLKIVNGKGGKSRTIPLNATCRSILMQYKRLSDAKLLQIAAKYYGHEGSSFLCRRIWQKTGMPRFGSHSLRHRFACAMVRKNVSIYKISRILGHNSLKTTELYLWLDDSELLDSTDVLD